MKKLKKTNVKKILSIFIIIISIISFSAILYASSAIITNPTILTFEDKNLYDAIKKQLSAKKISYNGNDVEKTIEISKNDIEKMTRQQMVEKIGVDNFMNTVFKSFAGNKSLKFAKTR